MDFSTAQTLLSSAGVEISSGLTDSEFDRVENLFGFQFPPDLREFLSIGLPVSKGWTDWRGDHNIIREQCDWPLEGICFDIEHNEFWLPEWGERPANLPDAFEIARRAVANAPFLIPIRGHRYLPATPAEPGNPVFSVYQTDIIHYGADLLDYLHNSFLVAFDRDNMTITGEPRRIEFWSRLVEMNW